MGRQALYKMTRFFNCYFTSRVKQKTRTEGSTDITRNAEKSLKTEVSKEIMEKSSTSNVDTSIESEIHSSISNTQNINNELNGSHSTSAKNIIHNHDFSGGLHLWHPNSCDAFVVSEENGYPEGLSIKLSGRFAVITNRKECWQGLEQDITNRVSAGSTYTVCAWVGVLGNQGVTDVVATLKLEYQDSSVSYLFIGKTSASMEHWEKLEGIFSILTMPHRVIFYIEGPSPGIDLLIRSVSISCHGSSQFNESTDIMQKLPTGSAEENLQSKGSRDIMKKPPSRKVDASLQSENINNGLNFLCSTSATNVIFNHDFSEGLHMWHPNCCDAFVDSEENGYREEPSAKLSGRFAVITNRKECWQGLEQDITDRVYAGSTYTLCAWVGVSGKQSASDVVATLKLEYQDLSVSYLCIGRTSASTEHWEKLEGTFSLAAMPCRVVFYLEGPSPGVNLLIRSVVVSCCSSHQNDSHGTGPFFDGNENIIQNPSFDNGLNNWSARGCQIALHDSMADGKVLPMTGKFFVSTFNRSDYWHGIQQEISGRVQRKLAYEVTATVRILGNNVAMANVKATLWLQGADLHEQYIGIASVQATDKDWVQLRGKFLINSSPSKVVIYLEGPPAGTDIVLNNLVVKRAAKVPPASPPVIEGAAFGVNIISNSNLSNGTNGWFPLGNCNLSVANGSPRIIPPMARDSLGVHEPLTGRYILVTNRTETWMGPAQMITDKLKLYLTYQVSAWVRTGGQASRPQLVNVALSVDGQWVNGGQVECGDDKWHEIGASFRIEKQPAKVMVYVQGPEGGVDLMVAGLQIFPVDRRLRFRHLKLQTDKVRKRDVTIKFTVSSPGTLAGSFVKIRQTENSFPFGSCISRSTIDNEDILDFITKNFNWAVFENELKWYWTEPQQGNLSYKDADDLLNLCTAHNIQLRGHCIFWESEAAVQPWIRALSKNDMISAVQSRLTGLLTRYKGKFKHYDVNNEMLHNSFYQDHLGKEIRVRMFKTANQLDPLAALFVNDYSIEDGSDSRSSPEKYIQHILDLQEQGAPVGGIGVQGHITSPVGPIVCSALDKLGILGLPIWFTEVDVSSDNEHIRADDLEVIMREAFAHPAVEGVVLWGFWELFMSRDNAFLVNAEGDVNEAGKRYLAVKQEWLTRAHGHVTGDGEFEYRGFHGSYEVEVVTPDKQRLAKTFVVDEGVDPVVIPVNF